ncbi:uncharacterized protein LOC117222236 [Megalopta genalis]|uniref:uncharacterized protein LOC117222236 n=1 Tax=Megalopta genalis TaxID=115081 RepID=UPI003FCFFAD9
MTAQESARLRYSLQNSPLSNVYLRIKPKSHVDAEENYSVLNSTSMIVKKGDSVERKFIFKKIFEPHSSQTEVFDQCTRQRVINLLSGQSSSIIAYGASDSGKTYTLYGTPDWPGIIPRSIEFIFSAINCSLVPWYKITDDNQVVSLNNEEKSEEIRNKLKLVNPDVIEKEEYAQARLSLDNSVPEIVEIEEREPFGSDGIFSVWLSITEIYNDNVYDLLAVDHQARRSLKLSTRRDGSTYVKGLNFVNVTTGLEACQLLILAQSRMTVSVIGSNETSSRSHTFFVIRLLRYQKENAKNEVAVSTLTFCDVAGTSRCRSSREDAVASTESKSIKNSLLVFGRCLKSVRDSYSNGDQAVGPFRESKLTRVLQKALTGKENLTFIVTIDTADQFFSETLGILNNSVIVRKIESDSKRGQLSELTPRSLKAYLMPIIGGTPRKAITVEEYEALQRRNDDLFEELKDLKNSRSECFRNNRRLQEENDKLIETLENMKCDRLNRELEIRDELVNQYSTVIEEIEASWKKRVQDIEDESRALLKKSVSQAETFYRERIDSIMRSKKRKRRDSGDNEESLSFYDELETENALVTSKVVLMKETVKNLKKENEMLSSDKLSSSFELSLLKEEVKDLRGSLQRFFPELFKDVQHEKFDLCRVVEKLKLLFDRKKKNIETLEKNLNESNENCVTLIAESSKKEEELREAQILSKVLENQLHETRTLVDSLKSQLQLLKESMSSCNKLRGFSSSSVSDFFCSEDVSTPELTTQAHVDTKLDRYFDYESMMTSRKMSPDDSEADMILRFSDGSAKEDSGIESSHRSRGSTGVGDSPPVQEVKEQYTQTLEDDFGTMEQRMEQLKIDYGKLEAQYSEEKACVVELSQQLDSFKAAVETVNGILDANDAKKDCPTAANKGSHEIQISAIPKELETWTKRIAEYATKIRSLQTELSEKSLEIASNNEKLKKMQQYTIDEYENFTEEYREVLRKIESNWRSNLEIAELGMKDINRMAEKLEQNSKAISIDCLLFRKLVKQLSREIEKKQEWIDSLNQRLQEKERKLCSLKKHKDLVVKKYEHLVRQLRIEIDKKKEKLLRLEKFFASNATEGYSKFVNWKLRKAKVYHLNRSSKNRSLFWLSHSRERMQNVKCLSMKSWSVSSQLCETYSESQASEQKEICDCNRTYCSEQSSSTEGSSGLNNSNAEDARQTQSDTTDCSEVLCKCGIGFRDPGRLRRMSGWMKVRRMNARTELSCQPDKKRDCVNTSDSETDVAERCFVGLNDYAVI